jgi:Heterokaryon incompatibility protein (HET)
MRRLQRLIHPLGSGTSASVKPRPRSLEKWAHRPLDKSRREIRLLEIFPAAKKDDVVACRVHTASLDDDPSYVALSYVWGDGSTKKEIVLDNKTFAISENLASVLKAIRSHVMPKWADDSPLRMWADAICINQDDVHERNDQVQMMGSIYSKAGLVISWLGPDDDSQIRTALRAIGHIAQEVDSDRGNLRNLKWMRKYYHLLKQDKECGSLYNHSWRAVYAMRTLEYWKRMWIAQEIALAGQWVLMTESHFSSAIDLIHFNDFIDSIRRHDVSRPSFIPKPLWNVIQGVWFEFRPIDMKTRYFHLRTAEKGEKFKFITEFLLHRASEPRDKVFALQGLFDNLVHADYSKSTRDIYSEYARDWILCSQDLYLLHYSGRGHGLQNEFGLLSWIPDWHAISSWETLTLGFANRFSFAADQGLEELSNSHLPQIANQFTLTAFGPRFDVIEQVLPPHGKDYPGNLVRICDAVIHKRDANGTSLLQVLLHSLSWEGDVTTGDRLDMTGTSACITMAIALKIALWGLGGELSLSVDSLANQLGISTQTGKFKAILKAISPGIQIPEAWDSDAVVHELWLAWAPKFSSMYLSWFTNFRFFYTRDGYLGYGPMGIAAGDEICFLRGCQSPVLLRREGSGYVFVGTCLMAGFMDGKAAKLVKEGKLKTESFEIY